MSLPPSTAAPAMVPIPPNVQELIGPQLMGVLFDFGLLGVLVVQGYVYHLSFPNDNVRIKWLVYFVVLYEIAVTTLNTVISFQWFASGFGNMLVVADPSFSPVNTPIMGSIIALIVQSFFCYRIYVIKRSAWWISALIFVVSLAQAAGGIAGGIRSMMFVGSTSESHANDQTILVYIWLIGSAVADIAIAVAMTSFLLKARIHNQTKDVIARIIRLTVESNSLTATVALIGLILYAGVPSAPYFITPTMIMGKLYSNTLLLTFNNRAFMTHMPSSISNSSGSGSSAASSKLKTVTSSQPCHSMPFRAGLNPDSQASVCEWTSGTQNISMVTYTTDTVVDVHKSDTTFVV